MPPQPTDATPTGVEGPPPPGTAPEGEVTPPVEPTPVAPTEPTAPVEPAPVEPPVDATRLQSELDWYQKQYGTSLQRMQEIQTSLDEYETAAMTDDERAAWQLQRERDQLYQQQDQMAQEAYTRDLWYYYQQFVPADQITGQDPTQWQDSVLQYLFGADKRQQQEIQRLQQENQQLRAAVVPGAGAPTVTTPGAPPSKPTITDLNWEELEALKQQAIEGNLAPEDYPAIPG